jgi:hypothetical protein
MWWGDRGGWVGPWRLHLPIDFGGKFTASTHSSATRLGSDDDGILREVDSLMAGLGGGLVREVVKRESREEEWERLWSTIRSYYCGEHSTTLAPT